MNKDTLKARIIQRSQEQDHEIQRYELQMLFIAQAAERLAQYADDRGGNCPPRRNRKRYTQRPCAL